ncbi:MAG: NAD(P)-dependent oxidoreductase [Verrucomicrobiota bacterium]
MISHHYSTPTPPKRVVSLGSRGFVAGRFGELLKAKGVDLLAFSSSDLDLTKSESVTYLSESLQPEDVVIMFSALTPDKGKDLKTYFSNMKMAEHVAAALEKSSPAHFIYISSDAVYSPKESHIDEETSCEAGDLYALMHLSREKIFQFCLRGIQKPLAILRPCAVYGSGDTHHSYGPNRFLKTALQEGKITLFGEGEEIRDHLWIEDLVEWIWNAAVHRSEGVVNLVSGKGISFGEVARLIAKNVSHPVEIVTVPRQSPVTHKEFNDSRTRAAFPNRPATEFEKGIASMMKQTERTL